MDAFKMFLVDTPGEKLFLLWVEIERLKTCDNMQERTRCVLLEVIFMFEE